MEMSELLPFMVMKVQQLAQVGSAVAAKEAMSTGMTTFTFTFYSCAFSTLLLIPFPSSSIAILQLIPGFTFILAVILRMENFEYKSLSTVAKTIGILVSIIGALVATLYKDPQVFGINPLNSILTIPSTWVIGGLLMMISSLIASVFIISQKKGPLFVVMFHPLGIVIAMAASIFMGEIIHVGSLVGSSIIVVGFYSVIWEKAKELKMGENSNNMPLIQNKDDDPEADS
ncbi:hypothetical protein RND71_023830 [Anisodus tanguticus]|uniref:WAT1-related protein n=1 Tax=Anisodus tanguticus TaxID=243964 RepID=A0AAE1RTU6_9SOLA|nr:hypothetical protein RND71_023830 [Anisodus tanguticus]